MDDERAARIAERVGGRRSRLLMAQAVLFTVWQGSYFAAHPETGAIRTVDDVRIAAWVVWAAALLLLLLTGGGWIWGREVRRRLNDELAVHHRHAAQRAGFWGAMVAGFVLYLVSFYEPLGPRDVIHLIFTLSIGAAFFRYAYLERQGERGG